MVEFLLEDHKGVKGLNHLCLHLRWQFLVHLKLLDDEVEIIEEGILHESVDFCLEQRIQ